VVKELLGKHQDIVVAPGNPKLIANRSTQKTEIQIIWNVDGQDDVSYVSKADITLVVEVK